MKQSVRTAAVAAVAFFAGIGIAHAPFGASPAALAAAVPLQPAAIDLLAIAPDAMPSPSATFPNLRSKTLVVADGMTVALQTGTVAKHTHTDANEVVVVLQGTGTEWLGEREVPLKAGTMLVIPKGTVHGGITASAPLTFVSVKTPPQDAADVHFVK